MRQLAVIIYHFEIQEIQIETTSELNKSSHKNWTLSV